MFYNICKYRTEKCRNNFYRSIRLIQSAVLYANVAYTCLSVQ